MQGTAERSGARIRRLGTSLVSDTAVQALFYAMLLVLPLSALAARRVPIAMVARYAAAWFVIFGVALFLAYSFSHK